MHALREGLGLREHDHRPFFRAVCCPEAMRGCGGLLRTAFNLSYLVIVVLSELRVFSERACASHVDIPLIEVLHREYLATAAEYNKLQNRISGQLRRRSQAEKSCKKGHFAYAAAYFLRSDVACSYFLLGRAPYVHRVHISIGRDQSCASAFRGFSWIGHLFYSIAPRIPPGLRRAERICILVVRGKVWWRRRWETGICGGMMV